MKKETTNITALKSKAWITESLLTLMKEKDFDKITITEMINKADLTRQTFYRNFESKENVLYEYVSKLYKDCFDEIDKMSEKNIRNIFITYFDYWHKTKDFLLLVIKCKLNYNIMDFYYPFMSDYFDKSIMNLHGKSTTEIGYIKYFLFGGLVQVKTHWMENGFKETPEELADLVLGSINPSIYEIIKN